MDVSGSVPGYHKGSDMHCWGHLRLRKLLEETDDSGARGATARAVHFNRLPSRVSVCVCVYVRVSVCAYRAVCVCAKSCAALH